MIRKELLKTPWWLLVIMYNYLFWQLQHSLSSQNFPHSISKTSSQSFTRWCRILRNSTAEHLSIDMLLSVYELVYYNVPQTSLTLYILRATSLKCLIQSSHISSESLDRFWLNHTHAIYIITEIFPCKPFICLCLLKLAIYLRAYFKLCLYTIFDRLWWNLICNTQILLV
jgi:hypothetical protein